MSPIDAYGKSGQLPCSVAEEALPQPESLPTPIAVLNAEPLIGAEIETPALPFADSLALTSPNSPLPVPAGGGCGYLFFSGRTGILVFLEMDVLLPGGLGLMMEWLLDPLAIVIQ
ncbi:hypothetical protein Nepgr_017366 [Nepenthes gracilis]|uniref:Uncharacterized protein n=1 Tax=Nepenthes gracilis TaxID=150966 RepID=A0AAD3XTB3_NEPGR|nr:hypothetical protein Nepgr_017366 [Nepenthes gracilis]